jgi:uncharacterized membrane protein YgaE (UPF0421/DUF939 family)
MAVTRTEHPHRSRNPSGKGRNKLGRMVRALFASGRPQLAFKAALAAGIAWSIAPLMPGVAAQYPYYAPLGALVCMYPTVAGSAKQALQTLLGLLMGIALAIMVIALGEPTVLTVAVVVGLGVLIAGLPRLGAGRDWIPMAALFVLVLGGTDNADEFSFGYASQMLVGVVVGLTVNFLVFPPLHFSHALQGLEELRSTLARQLKDMGTAMKETWPPEHEEWATRESGLSQLSRDVHAAVKLAESSQRANVRRRIHPRDITTEQSALQALERMTFYVEDMTEVLSGVIWRSPEETPVPLPLSEPLGNALIATGEAVEDWNDEELLAAAEAAQDHLATEMNRLASPDDPVDATASLALALRRIVRTLRSLSRD